MRGSRQVPAGWALGPAKTETAPPPSLEQADQRPWQPALSVAILLRAGLLVSDQTTGDYQHCFYLAEADTLQNFKLNDYQYKKKVISRFGLF